MRKPRVAFFIDQWRPGSGTENQLQGMLSYLVPDQIEARLYTLREPLADQYAGFFPCPTECLHVDSLLHPKSILRLPLIARGLRRHRFDAAMIYFVDSNLYLVPVARLAGIPAVVVNRRDMGYWYEDGLLRNLNFVNRWASHFLVNAQAVKSQVVRHEHFAADRIKVIPNGLWDADHLHRLQAGGAALAMAGVPSVGPLVGITASLREVKGIDRFLDMAARVRGRVPAARFVIAGRGHLLPALEEQVDRLGLGDHVVFLGQVRDVPALLARLQVAVLTSDSEGLSNSLVEYGLAGVPAVAFDVGGNGEVVRDRETGYLVPPGDVSALADRVCDLLLDESLRHRLGEAARDHCATTFAPDRIGGLILEFLVAAGRVRERQS